MRITYETIIILQFEHLLIVTSLLELTVNSGDRDEGDVDWNSKMKNANTVPFELVGFCRGIPSVACLASRD